MRSQLAACAVVTALLSAPGAPADDTAAAQPGDLWEVTSQPSFEGMPVPLPKNTVKVCSPKEWTEPPGAADERRKCTSSDLRWDGTTATWKTTCAGPPSMTGEGRLTRNGADAWSGSIQFASSEGAMTVKLEGRRVGGCDKPVR